MHTQRDLQQALVIGTMDTKGEEMEFLGARLRERGVAVQLLDATPSDWLSEEDDPESRREVMDIVAARVAERVRSLHKQGLVGGAVAIGGASGAALVAGALQTLPLGFPKVLVSPIVSGVTTPYIGTSDTIMIPPIIDFTGLNAYAEKALDTAAATLVALMDSGDVYPDAGSSTIAGTGFAVTTPLVSGLGRALQAEGLRQAVFVCNGIGGRSYERFIEEGKVFGSFDVTTSELADEMFGGVLSAGPSRLTTAARLDVPQVVLPGAMDFINFGAMETVPHHYRDRNIVQHTPEVTLVRTSPEQNERLGQRMAERLRAGSGRFTVVVPLRGFSLVSETGKPFHDPKADRAFLDALRHELGEDAIVTVDAPLNSDEVAAEVMRVSKPWRRNRQQQIQ